MGCPVGGLLELACEPKVGALLRVLDDLSPFLLVVLLVVVEDLKFVFLPDTLTVAVVVAVVANFFFFCFPIKNMHSLAQPL